MAISAFLEVVTLGLPDSGEIIRSELDRMTRHESAGFIADARSVITDYDGDADRAHNQSGIESLLFAALDDKHPEAVWRPDPVTPIRPARDLNYHWDSLAPSPSVKLRIHYAANGVRELKFSNVLPTRFLDDARKQGFSGEIGPASEPVVQTGEQLPGMFAIFVISGGLVGNELYTPTKHQFSTIDPQGGVTWSRRDMVSQQKLRI